MRKIGQFFQNREIHIPEQPIFKGKCKYSIRMVATDRKLLLGVVIFTKKLICV